jgi:hypothetical protein
MARSSAARVSGGLGGGGCLQAKASPMITSEEASIVIE